MAPSLIVVHGVGRKAGTIADTLAADPRYRVRLVAPEPEPGQPEPRLHPAVERVPAGVLGAVREGMLAGAAAVIMAGEVWDSTANVARLARRAGCHYLDVDESPSAAAAIAAIAEGAPGCFAPACGLAPGYVTALVAGRLRRAGPGARVTVHVGVLPARRVNRLGYGNLLGVDGLLLEYSSPCRAIRQGRQILLLPLTEREEIAIGGERFESFTTAGSLDALVAAPGLQARELVFKTLRYPGHLDYMRFLLDDLRLAGDRNRLRSLLMNGLPTIDEDRVLIALDLTPAGAAVPERFEQVIPARRLPDGTWASAGIAATAAHVCALADLLCSGRLVHPGFLPQGVVGLDALRSSPFFAPLAVTEQGETLAAQGSEDG